MILILLQGCYNIKEIVKPFLTNKRYNVLITTKILILLLLRGCYSIKEIAMQFLTD